MSMEYQLEMAIADISNPSIKGQPDDEAIRMIREFEHLALENDPRGYCVCTSEGKDSRVLGHLFRRARVKHFYLHNITGIDPPELVYFQRANFQDYRDDGYITHDIMYQKSMWQLMVENKFPPMRNARYCCKYLKEYRAQEQGSALLSFGVRKYESTNRAKRRDELEIKQKKDVTILSFDNHENRRTFEFCYAQCEKRLNPLAYWPDSYIWDYSREANITQCTLYSEGFERLGCIGCPMAGEAGRRREFARWPGFVPVWIRAFDKIIEARKNCGMKVWDNSGSEWFEQWLRDKIQEKPIDENQLEMGLHYE